MLEGLWSILVLLALGMPGWLVLNRLSVPGSPVIGPMMSIAVLTGLGYQIPVPPAAFRPVLQIIVGLFIGAQVTRGIGSALKRMVLPSILVSGWWLAVSLGLGYCLYIVSPLDLVTAFVGSTAGGMAEMSLLAVSLDADAAKVAILQFFRLSMTLVAVPVLGPRLFSRGAWAPVAAASDPDLRPPAGRGQALAGTCRLGPPSGRELLRQAVPSLAHVRVLAAATAGGLLLYAAGFPAGGLVGAMIAVGAINLSGLGSPAFPEWARLGARVGLGGLIGLSFSAGTLRSLAQMAVPIAILTIALLLNGFLLALMLRKLTDWNMETCILAASAGGLTQMSMISEDLGADPAVVTMVQLVRLVSIIVILPLLFSLILV